MKVTATDTIAMCLDRLSFIAASKNQHLTLT